MVCVTGLFVLSFYISSANAIVLPAVTQAPEARHRRENAPTIPTFTFGPTSRYFPTQAGQPEASGTSIEIFPTGIYDTFPDDGITVALGPELRSRVKDAVTQNCGNGHTEQACHNAVTSVLHETNISAHTKRFLGVGFATAAVIIGLVAIVGHLIVAAGIAVQPAAVKLDVGDLSQIHSLGAAQTFAAVTEGVDAAPTTIINAPVPSTTNSNFVTIETLTADKDGHKAGSVVYHIPQHAADRIQDFLAITGIKETQHICKDQNIKRADNLQECLRHLQRHAMDLADVGPSDLIQLAPQNIPTMPGQGQAISFPIADFAADGIILLIPVYRSIREQSPMPVNEQGWDPAILGKSAMALTIAAHVAMFAGQSLLDIWIEKDQLVTDLKPESLSCRKELICSDDDCKAQEVGKDLDNWDVSPPSSYGCRCEPVIMPHVMTIQRDYMDKQYEWLEELIKKSSGPDYGENCGGGEQTFPDSAKKLKEYAHQYSVPNGE
ncbi:hypothetical protein DE146DRAFT_749767 [Phaeosphaeria sp. MPI-PUGE-AT-0046c]|nr:hypothetical protein DE146DRAFT_749767 [Phaeosphaeria sp. MPI-PUGE-AT-0046c]